MVAEHTVKAFDEDITRLRGLIAEMVHFAALGTLPPDDDAVSIP